MLREPPLFKKRLNKNLNFFLKHYFLPKEHLGQRVGGRGWEGEWVSMWGGGFKGTVLYAHFITLKIRTRYQIGSFLKLFLQKKVTQVGK